MFLPWYPSANQESCFAVMAPGPHFGGSTLLPICIYIYMSIQRREPDILSIFSFRGLWRRDRAQAAKDRNFGTSVVSSAPRTELL